MLKIIIAILAIAGIVDAGYLTWHYYRKKPLVCSINHDCNKVSMSKWSSVFGLRNEIIGLGFYFALLIGLAITILQPELTALLYILIFAASSSSLAFSVFLVFIQIFAIKEFCIYCLISAGINTLIFITSLLLFFSIN